jgi:26S proteasome regulatory subunit N9
MVIDVVSYLAEQQRKSSHELAQEWAALDELYNKKLWHQLTLRLLQFIRHPSLSQGDALVKLYQNFIADFEHRINSLALAEIAILVAQQIKDVNEAVEFLETVRGKVKASDEAVVLCSTAIGSLHLRNGDMEKTKTILRSTQTTLDGLDGITTVHGRFYELSSEYHKLMGNYADYYRDALRFLGCIDLTTLSTTEQAERAFNIGLAAILGLEIYNFGELLAHPVLEALRSSTSEQKWLVDLLFAFNSGNIQKFEQLRPYWEKQPDLAVREAEMRRKIALLGLMEMTFRRPATDRHLSFNDIAAETQLPVTSVEHLVMKALSLQLIHGSIDEVDQRVHVTWVQPRVLDLSQITEMKKKMTAWSDDVSKIETLVEKKAVDILV